LTKLGIPNSGLAGPFPSEILEIITLHELDLSFNMFHGTVPHDISLLSSNLTTLLLNNNEFTGTIPTQLGLLTELTELDLSVNGFEGQLPEELNNLINLEVLAIKNQNNQDGFPSLNGPLLDFQNLTVLTELYLQDNELSGTIPSSFLKNSAAKSDAAVYVGLSRNQLNGTVPASLGNLEHMIIDLDDNNITNIDSSLCTSKNWMEGNVDKYGCDGILCPAGWYQKFSGRQTSDASPCTKCQLAGGAPFMGSKTCVNTVDKIARGILNTLYIQTGGDNWYMKGNWTSPDVPVCFWHGIKCHSGGDKISSIQLGANNLIGTSPPELFDLPGLNELWLYSNPMQVNFTGIERANTLRTLLLDGMGLVSIDGLGKGNSLERLDLRFNSINGSFPYEEITSLVNLKSLSLANNLLTGPLVSYGFDKLANLTNLRLDNNVLTGALPDFADFPSLVSLDVSNNKFDSSIPAKFLAGILYTSNLIAVNLANNELTGEISSDVFGRFKIMTLYVRGNKFTSMSEALCKMNQWNDGDVGQYGCDALACPLGHANEMGRRSTDSNFCVVCQAAKYLGTTECTSPGFNARSNSAGISIFGSFSRWAVKSLLASLIGVVFFV
jgi:Leucine-rich repeat (LRR) protein